MSSNGWQVVDTKQRKAEKQQQKGIEKKKLQKQIEQERQKRKEEEERLSYSGWGPEDEDAKKKKKALKAKLAQQKPKKKELPQVADSNPFTAATIYTQLRAFEEAKEKKARAQQSALEWKAKEAERAAEAEAEIKRRKEKERKKKKPKKPSVAHLSAALDVASCRTYMEELSSRYPAKYDVQLMALADFFESKFGKASLGPAKLLDEKSFARKLEIPYAYLDDAVAEALQTWLATVPPTVMAEFTQFLLNEVFSAEKNHKTSGIGLRMLLAAIARGFPDVVRGAVDHASFVQKYLGDSPATYPKHEPNVLSEDTALLRANFVPVLVWYFGQTIEDHPALAFDLWAEFLLPFLLVSAPETIRTLVLDYFHLLFTDVGGKVKRADPVVTARALERLAAYRESVSENQLKKGAINPIYLAIENAIVWRNSSSVHNYLNVYLRRAASANKHVRDEAQKKVLRALAVDKESYQTWDSLYPRYVLQSTQVILFLTDKWDKYVLTQDKGTIQASDVAETVHNFLYTNEKLAESHYRLTTRVKKGAKAKKEAKADQADVEASTAACRELLRRTGAKVSATASSRPTSRSRAQHAAAASSRASSASSSSSGFLGTLVYLLLFVALVAAIAVLYLRQTQPETYEELLRTGLAYYREGQAHATVLTAQASAKAQDLLAQAYELKAKYMAQAQPLLAQASAKAQELLAQAHELKAKYMPATASPAAAVAGKA